MIYKAEINIPEIVIKDFEIDLFCKKYPYIKDIILEIKKIIGGNFKHYLVNVTAKNYKTGDKTCKDIRYHFDGDYYKDNVYCLWCKGPNRTIFPTEKLTFKDLPVERYKQNIYLENLLKDIPSKEVEDQTFVKYTSQDPHKGVICAVDGFRTFIRVMGTNYINPVNYVKRN